MVRHLMAIVLLTIAAQVSAQDLDYSCEALPLHKALSEVSRLAKAPLLVSQELARDPVVLRLAGVPLEDFKLRIAELFVAEWVPTREGPELRRTPKVVEVFEKARREAWIKGLKDSLDAYAGISKSPLLSTEEAERIATTYVKMLLDEQSGRGGQGGMKLRTSFSNRTADMRLLAEMLTAIGPERLGNLPQGVAVFAYHPTAMQHDLGPLTDEQFARYLAHRNVLADAIQRQSPEDRELWDTYGNSAMASASVRVSGPIRPLLTITADPERNQAWLYFAVYDGRGEAVISLPLPFGITPSLDAQSEDRARAAAAAASQPDIPLSPPVPELSKRMDRQSIPLPALAGEALALVLGPEDRDPMNTGIAEVLLRLSELEGRNLIATLGDDQIRPVRSVQGKVRAATFENRLTGRGQVSFDREEDWLLVRSANPIHASRTRLDRHALGMFLRAWDEKGFLAIEDWADLAVASEEADDLALPLTLWNVLRGDASSNGSNDVPTLRVYGLLSQIELDALLRGQALPYHTLSQPVQAALNRLLYQGSSNATLRKLNPDVRGGEPPELQGIWAEPTEGVPNGIPANSMLRARESKTEEFYVVNSSGGMISPRRPTPLVELASMLAYGEARPAMEGGVVGVSYGTRRIIRMELQMSDKVSLVAVLQEDRLPKGPPISVDRLAMDLPPAAWQNLKKHIELSKEQFKRMPLEEPRQHTPPPF